MSQWLQKGVLWLRKVIDGAVSATQIFGTMPAGQLDPIPSHAASTSLISLPHEIQIRVYNYYYPRWSLVVHDDMFSVSEGSSLFKLPTSQRQGLKECRRCPPDECPNADYAAIFKHESTSTYVPSINLILVCRKIRDLAYPVFQSSYTKIIEADIASYCLANTTCWTLFVTRFRQMLTKTHTLHLDVARQREFGCIEDQGENFSLMKYAPNLRKATLRDAFKLTNAHTLLDDLGAWSWTTEVPKEKLEKLLMKAAEKRMESTGTSFRVGACIFGQIQNRREDPDLVFDYRYEYRCRVEGIESVYVSVALAFWSSY